MWSYAMAKYGINIQVSATNREQHCLAWLLSGIVVRMLIAFIVGCIIFLAFFVSGVISH
jgi:hypothetical protein